MSPSRIPCPLSCLMLGLGWMCGDLLAIDFNREIRPILAENCFQCHGPDAAERKGALRLDTEDGAHAVLVPGRPDRSDLLSRIHATDSDEQMPPPDSQKMLSDEQKRLLHDWIARGAPWAEHWAFVRPIKPPLPEVSAWDRNAIDPFVRTRMRPQELEPSPEANKATLIRRLTLDLTGLPPAPDEVSAFIEDTRPDAYERVVSRLLASPRHGEHLAWRWLEAARYADTDGYQNDGPREMWPWRDWVIDAYNHNLPFDQFTVEQLAGDLLPHPTRAQRIATGFNRNHRYNSESGLVLEEFLLENAVDRVDTTATVWMGMTASCARCHDHKYDPLSQKEYYQLLAYFNNVPESGRAIKFGNSEPWIQAPTAGQEIAWTQRRQAFAKAQETLAKAAPEIRKETKKWAQQSPELLEPILTEHLAFLRAESLTAPSSTQTKIDGLIGNGRFSVSAHVTAQNVDEAALLSTERPGSERQGILIALHEGHVRFQIITRWIAGVGTVETTRTFQPGESFHLAVTNDGTQRAQGMRIYINGQLATTRIRHNTNSNRSPATFGDVLRLGSSPHVASLMGTLRDIRIYTGHTLRAEDIQLLAEPTALSSIASLPAHRRTPRQAAALQQAFLEQAAPSAWKRMAQRVRETHAALLAFEDALPTTMVMEERPTVPPTHLRIRGVYDQRGELVQRATPARFPPMPEKAPRNRLGLAQWLVDNTHPLTARVAVNRLWEPFFGRGLVHTAEDFGVQGSPPSHPHLLDWLAVTFMERGWDRRQLLRQFVLSATYRQSSQIRDIHRQRDPKNVYLSRATRRRLTGNLLRDQALFLSGLLVEQRGGPSVKPYQPANLWREASNFSYQVGQGADLYRRSLYTYWKRTLAPPTMAILDTADREWCAVNAKQTNTPLQALTLLNEPTFIEAARELGVRIGSATDDPAEQVRFGFRLVTSRQPTAQEHTILTQALQRYRDRFKSTPQAARALLQVDSPSSRHGYLAACVALANVLLNLDEVTTRE